MNDTRRPYDPSDPHPEPGNDPVVYLRAMADFYRHNPNAAEVLTDAADKIGAYMTNRLDGAALIAEERLRQIEVERWTSDHDAGHDEGQLLAAADCYLAHVQEGSPCYDMDDYVETHWPWSPEAWKPKDPIRDLVRAGALIAAEIDRLQRAQP